MYPLYGMVAVTSPEVSPAPFHEGTKTEACSMVLALAAGACVNNHDTEACMFHQMIITNNYEDRGRGERGYW